MHSYFTADTYTACHARICTYMRKRKFIQDFAATPLWAMQLKIDRGEINCLSCQPHRSRAAVARQSAPPQAALEAAARA